MNRREFTLGTIAMAMPGTAPKYRIIDPQVHVWKNDPALSVGRGNEGCAERRPHAGDASGVDARQHVERTVIAQYIGYRWDNRYALDSMKKYAPNFMAVCRVNPSDPAAPDAAFCAHSAGISRGAAQSRGRR